MRERERERKEKNERKWRKEIYKMDVL